MVRLCALEQVREVKKLIILAEGLQNGVAGHTEVHGPGLGQLYHIRLGAQELAGIHLHPEPVPQPFPDHFLEGSQRQMGRMVHRLVVADTDDPAGISPEPAAA